MPSFQELFEASKGKPIIYKGKELVLYDTWKVAQENLFVLSLESTGSEWRQGISLWTDKGHILCEGKKLKGFSVWQEELDKPLALRVYSRSNNLYVKNIWDIGNGGKYSWYYGAAMIVEQTSIGRRYRCNDGHPDDNFDDIIFRLELLSLNLVDSPL